MGRPESRYLPALDGLRAVAVAAVLAFHLGRVRGGFLGVDVFFVVSGFLITRLLLAERETTGGIGLGRFWARRFRRLVPALLVVLVATVLASRWWLAGWRITGVRTDALAALAYVANWRFVASGQSYFATGIGPSPLRHTWSLAIEEQFYLGWPLLVVGATALARRLGTAVRATVAAVATVIVVASAAWMAVAAGRLDLTRVYYGTDTRLFALGAGALLACGWDRFLAAPADRAARRRRAERMAIAGSTALVPLAALVATTSEAAASSYRGAFQATSLLAAVAVAGLAGGVGPVATVLSSAPLRWLGRRSYGIYLWSWPVQVFAADRFRLDGWTLDLVVVLGSLALAALSFALVEDPIRTGRPIPRPWAVRSDGPVLPSATVGVRRAPGGIGTAALSVAVVAAVVAGAAIGAPPEPELLLVSDEEARSVALDPTSGFTPLAADDTTTTTVGSADPTVTTAPVGPFASTVDPVVRHPAADPMAVFGRPLRIMVAGDSVGWSLAWAASRSDLLTSVQISNRALIGCGILPARAVRLYAAGDPAPYDAACDDSTEAQFLGLAEHPDVVLFWVGAWEVIDHRLDGTTYDVGTKADARLIERTLQERLDLFRDAGVPTVVPLVACFADSPQYTERLDADRIAWINARIRAVVARNRTWVRAIDPTPVLCNADGTARVTNEHGVVIRADGAHFEAEAGAWFWNTWLAGAVASAFGRTDS